MRQKDSIILAIESSCDDTSAAILKNETILSNCIAGQQVHEQYGGVVPELASRAHLQNIVPVIHSALGQAKVQLSEVDAIAFTKGPGLMGSLVVGVSYAKSLALALNKPLIDVNHMVGHVLAHFIDDGDKLKPSFPFLCLTISGGHTQIVLVRSALNLEVIGTTIDDAAGEAFDKAAKMLGFPYPGGPLIDRHAQKGNPKAFQFAHPKVSGYDFSFSGLKTSILYFLESSVKQNPNFIEENLDDLCASIQQIIIEILFKKLKKASLDLGISEIAIAGGVSANSGIRQRLMEEGLANNWKVFVPKFEYCTDNAAMIAIAAKFMLEEGIVADQHVTAMPRLPINS